MLDDLHYISYTEHGQTIQQGVLAMNAVETLANVEETLTNLVQQLAENHPNEASEALDIAVLVNRLRKKLRG